MKITDEAPNVLFFAVNSRGIEDKGEADLTWKEVSLPKVLTDTETVDTFALKNRKKDGKLTTELGNFILLSLALAKEHNCWNFTFCLGL